MEQAPGQPPLKIENILESEEALTDILSLEKDCFPLDWQYPDAADYYAEVLKDPQNINLFLKEDCSVIGYVLARPHNIVVEELQEHDPVLAESKKERFYIETIQVHPKSQGKGGGKALLLAVCEEAKKRGVTNFSIHARTTNKLNLLVRNLFKEGLIVARPIASWEYASGEPYEYIEWNI